MQYKIPVQIENEDKIFLNLSLRQLMIMMIGFSMAYSVFTSLEKNVGGSIALFPTVIIGIITFIIAVFKHTEMTFVPFLLNLIRLQLNSGVRVWSKGVESFTNVEVGYIPPEDTINDKMQSKISKNIHEDILSKI